MFGVSCIVLDQIIIIYTTFRGHYLQNLKEAVEINNSVPQGLSSSIFTKRPDIIFKWIG